MIDDEATIDLDQVRARLWRAFGAYPRHLSPETATGDEDIALKRRLSKTRLEDLSPSDAAAVLRSYCGEARALKHFLPRLLDLAVAPGGQGLHFADVVSALRRHDLASWPPEERRIVDLFLSAHGLRSRGTAGG